MTTNRFPATCERCHGNIEPGEGFVKGGKGSDGTWAVVHNSCIPVLDVGRRQAERDRPWIKGLEYDL